MSKVYKSLIQFAKTIRGKKLYELKIFGIQIYLITTTYKSHYNVFLFYLPLFRIEKDRNRFAINILPFVWLYKFITGWRLVFLEKGFKITFLNRTVFEDVIVEPYKFPAACFKD